MTMIQLIDFRTEDPDQIRALDEQWRAAIGDASTVQRSVLAEDRAHPGAFLEIVWFESPEAAEANSEHPATQEFAAKFAALCVGEPNYCNLDVRDDRAG